MNRSGWLAAIAVALVPVPGLAQPGGPGGGFRAVGAFGGDAGDASAEVQRTAEVEMEGGQRVRGQIGLKPLTVESDVGRYAIDPDKIRMIRFLKPPAEAEAGNAEEVEVKAVAPGGAAMGRANRMMGGMMGGMMARGFMPDPLTNVAATRARGKVSTTTGKDIVGNIYLPADFKIALDVGTLYLAADKLRTLTFTDAGAAGVRANEPVHAVPDTVPAPAGQPESPEADRSPTSSRLGDMLLISTPGSSRVAMYDLKTRKTQAIELGDPKDPPVQVTFLTGADPVALLLNGPKITKIAVADVASGTWHVQDLRQPFRGQAAPIAGPGLAVYILGRYAYAYSVRIRHWEVIEVPEGLRAEGMPGFQGVTIQGRGHIYSFSAETGKWDHLDLRAILDAAGAEKK
jgi:hypothetical protein